MKKDTKKFSGRRRLYKITVTGDPGNQGSDPEKAILNWQ